MQRNKLLTILTTGALTLGLLCGCGMGSKAETNTHAGELTIDDNKLASAAATDTSAQTTADDHADQTAEETASAGTTATANTNTEDTVTENADTANTASTDTTAASADAANTSTNTPAAPAPTQPDDPVMDMIIADMDQQDVRLGDLIAANKVTMLNFWGTFCGPCIMEMPDLAELEQTYRDQGFEILGLTIDILDYNGSYDAGAIADAHDIADDTGVTYPLLVATEELMDYAGIEAVPTSYLVDAQGHVLLGPVVGVQNKADWDEYIRQFLAQAE
ncbi:MAG: TlpA family protein disulfide reductase [Butyrivibrio sp.]|nr:TlpA family protein disulfide reductase [Butyrivibrio sp.]